METKPPTVGIMILTISGIVILAVLRMCGGISPAETALDFPGTVLAVDVGAGKLSVKKEGGGTRFTFVVNDKTQFEGAGLKSLKDVKKGDNVTVNYVVTGSQYIAQKVSKK